MLLFWVNYQFKLRGTQLYINASVPFPIMASLLLQRYAGMLSAN